MSRIFIAPLEAARDYETAIDRLEELEEIEEAGDQDDLDEDDIDEIEALHKLIQEFETREGIEEEDDDDVEPAHMFGDREPEQVASFMLSNGNSVRFLASPDGDEVFYGEIAADGSEQLVLHDGIAPVALYDRLADAKAAVPRALARLDDTGRLEARKVKEVVTGEMGVDVDALAGVFAPAAMSQQGSCQSDPAGRNYFHTHHCDTAGGPGYGKSESHCYASAYHWIQKTSHSRRRATWSRTAACGSSTCRLLHQYKKARGWHTQLTIYTTPPRVEGWWSYKKGIRRYRRIRVERLSNSAIVRAYVRYHSQVAGGW